MPTIEEQLVEVYSVLDRLRQIENELRASIDNAVETLKKESPDHGTH